MVAAGEMAPDFDVTSSAGERIKLSDFRGKKNVVLFFYPGDFTPVCTKEACSFRDNYDTLRSGDTEIIGVSADSDESHRKFSATYRLEYPLIADEEKTLAKRFGATGLLTSLIGRVSRTTVVIDKTGRIADVIKGELSANVHVEGAARALASLPK